MANTLSGNLTDKSSHPATSTAEVPPEESSPEAEATIRLRILVVDDDHTLRESCASILQLQGHDVSLAARGQEALDTMRRRRFDVALIDLYMSDVSGMELLRAGLKANPEMIPIVITGKPSVNSSVEALRAGAWDYLPKPFSATQLQVLIGRAAHAVSASQKTQELQHYIETRHGHSQKVTALGVSPAFRKIVDVSRRVAPTDASVFVTGESGSGKELIAQFIHHHSRRARKPLVPLNCA
ncbi:MAG: sigma-54-dependent Fis family transcriptional regulator, partial [Gemmatimonadota bacterium]